MSSLTQLSLFRNRLDRDCFRALPLQIRLEMRTFVLCLTHLRWRVPRDVQHLIFIELLRSRPLIVDEPKREKKKKKKTFNRLPLRAAFPTPPRGPVAIRRLIDNYFFTLITTA